MIQIPPDVYKRLRAAVDAGLEQWDSLRLNAATRSLISEVKIRNSIYFRNNREENQIDVVYTPQLSKFIDLDGLDDEVVHCC